MYDNGTAHEFVSYLSPPYSLSPAKPQPPYSSSPSALTDEERIEEQLPFLIEDEHDWENDEEFVMDEEEREEEEQVVMPKKKKKRRKGNTIWTEEQVRGVCVFLVVFIWVLLLG